ncbi:LpxI family protein [Plastoroseomonas arctica]|uniref:LpxI family protein n=1 Tax=Plastoroseomonas arctica TaxID=1509237 RepID=A0AAF1KJW5_9PROT|nr:UDP-2,3-diacylglucosamine diphosphatase LpxI [Plastoroseomonas arctica]MBR0655935.1 LpxI family protein [Plastoroseomonas arctica]
MSAPAPLGMFAGGGGLPHRLAEAAAAQGRQVHVVAISGFAKAEDFAPHRAIELRFGQIGQALEWLREAGVRELVMGGQMRRPSVLSLMPDAAGLRILARIGLAAFRGDDSIHQAVIKVLQEEGIEVIGAQDLIEGLLPKAGLLAGTVPDDLARGDIARGIEVAGALGAVDVGQSVVVQQGLVLGVEGIEGTDALIVRCGELRRDGPGGVLVKRVKPGQSRLVDLPTIGPQTIAGAAAAGLRGVAFEADGTILMERAATVAAAEAAGLFLLAFDPANPNQE